MVNHEVNKAGLLDILGGYGETNVRGERQQKLGVFANEKYIQALGSRGIV